MDSTMTVACFLDVENILGGYGRTKTSDGHLTIRHFLNYLEQYVIQPSTDWPIRVAYADWTNPRLRSTQQALTKHGFKIENIIVLNRQRLKDVLDIQLAVDVVEVLLQKSAVTHFVIGSGDGGYASLGIKLRAYGKSVTFVGYNGSIAEVLEGYCDQIHRVPLPNRELAPKPHPAKTHANNRNGAPYAQEEELFAVVEAIAKSSGNHKIESPERTRIQLGECLTLVLGDVRVQNAIENDQFLLKFLDCVPGIIFFEDFSLAKLEGINLKRLISAAVRKANCRQETRKDGTAVIRRIPTPSQISPQSSAQKAGSPLANSKLDAFLTRIDHILHVNETSQAKDSELLAVVEAIAQSHGRRGVESPERTVDEIGECLALILGDARVQRAIDSDHFRLEWLTRVPELIFDDLSLEKREALDVRRVISAALAKAQCKQATKKGGIAVIRRNLVQSQPAGNGPSQPARAPQALPDLYTYLTQASQLLSGVTPSTTSSYRDLNLSALFAELHGKTSARPGHFGFEKPNLMLAMAARRVGLTLARDKRRPGYFALFCSPTLPTIHEAVEAPVEAWFHSTTIYARMLKCDTTPLRVPLQEWLGQLAAEEAPIRAMQGETRLDMSNDSRALECMDWLNNLVELGLATNRGSYLVLNERRTLNEIMAELQRRAAAIIDARLGRHDPAILHVMFPTSISADRAQIFEQSADTPHGYETKVPVTTTIKPDRLRLRIESIRQKR